MLLSLTQWLQVQMPEWGFLRVFQYLTFRAVMAALTALLIGLVAGPKVIRYLTAVKIGQPVRGYAMQSHLVKSGTPTMGGVLVLISIGLATLLWADWTNRFVWIVLLVTLSFGAIGWVDDWRKVVAKDPEGMPSKEKYLWQSLVGLLAALALVFAISESSNAKVWELFQDWVSSGFSIELPPTADLLVPFFKTVSYPLGVLGFVVLTYLVIVGSSNAVNLTDGLDGSGDHARDHGGLGLGCLCLRDGQCQLLALPQLANHCRHRGVAHFLCGYGGRGPRLFVVQRPSRAGVYGRRGCLGSGRRLGNDCGDR